MTLKKSESLEVRLSQPLKAALMDRSRASGASASETVRGLIESYLQPAPRSKPRRWVRLLIAAAAAVSVGTIAAPSLARPSPQAVFKAMDRRHVRRLSFDDFNAVATINADVYLTRSTPIAFYGSPSLLQQRSDLVTAEVRRAILRRTFDLIDTDHDGEISLEEFRRYYGG